MQPTLRSLSYALQLMVVLCLLAPHSALRAAAPDAATQPATLYLPAITASPDPTLPRPLAPANGAQVDSLIPVFRYAGGQMTAPAGGVLDFGVDPDPARTGWLWSFPLENAGEGFIRPIQNLMPATTYYWRVGVVDDFDYSRPPRWSEQLSFTTPAPGSGDILPAPPLLSPINGTVVTLDLAILRWEADPGAADYTVYVAKADEPFMRTMLPATTNQLPLAGMEWLFSPGVTYEWHVKARNDYAWSPQSSFWHFTVAPGRVSSSGSPAVREVVHMRGDQQHVQRTLE